MVFVLRENNKIRNVKSLDGKQYWLQKSAYGFGEQVTFYDEDGKEIENFIPTSDYHYTDGIYEYVEEEIVEIEGINIRTRFSFSEWYE